MSSLNPSTQGKIWDRFAEKYAEQPIADEESYQKKLSVSQTYFRPHMNIVEVGCGTGGTSLIHAPFVKHILATDVSEKMIQIARGKMQAHETEISNVDFQVNSIDGLDIKPASKDAVLALNILHLIPNRDDTIRRMHGWLQPGGVLITSTPCIGDAGWFVRWPLAAVISLGKCFKLLPSVEIFKKRDYKESLARNGFEIDYEWQPNPKSAVFIVAKKKG